MSSIPLVASAADVPRAVRYAERNPSARWYVARRAASLGCPEAVPAEWLEAADASPLTAASGKAKKPASVLAKVIDAAWDAALHPRGRDGKFIEKGGAVDVVVPGWPKTRGTAVGVRKDAWGNEVLTISFEPDVYKKLQDAGHLPSGPYTKDESRVQLAPKWVEAAPDQKANLPDGPESVSVGDEVVDPAETVGELEKGWVVQLVVEGELVEDRDEALSALLAVFPGVDQADLGDVTPVDGRPGHWRTAIPGEVALRARNDGEFADSAEMVFAEDGDEFVDQVSIVVNALDAPDLVDQEQLDIDEQLQDIEDQEFDDLYWSSEVIMADLDADGEGTLVEDLQKALDERIGEIKKIDDPEERDRAADMLRDAMDDIAGHSLGEAPEGATDEDIADLEDRKAEVLHAAQKALDEVSTPPHLSPTPVDEPAAAKPELTGYQKAFRKSFADEIRSYGYDALDDEDDDEELSSQIESLAQGIESGEFVSPEDALDQLDMLGVLDSEDREDIWRSAHLAGNQATYGPDDIDRMLDDTIEAIYGDADDWDDPDVAYPGSLDREGKLDALVTDVGDWDSAEDRGMALAAIAWAEDVSTADDTPEPELVEDLPLLLLNGEPDDIMAAYAGDSDLLSSIAGDFEQAGIDHPDRAGDLADQLEKVIEREAEAWSYTGSPADLGVDEADWGDYVADRDASIAEANMIVSKLRGETPSDSDAPAPAAPVQPFGTYDPKYDHLREAWYGTILDADGNQLDPEEFEAAAAALGIRNPQFSPDGDGMLMELSDERLDQLANDGAIDVEAGGYRLEVEGFDSDDLATQLADLEDTPVPDSDVLAGKSVYQLRDMALDPSTPADALERIARGDDELATGHALQNPGLPVDVAFDVMASSPSTGDDRARLYGWHLARRPDLTPDRIDQLRAEFPGSSPDEGSVHRQLALNTNVPAAVRNQIIADRPQLKLDPVPDSDTPDTPDTPDTSGDYIPGADTPQAKLIYAGLYSSASNKGVDVVDTGIDQRLDALLLNPDREAAHKDLAAIMTQLKLGGKQRKRYREMLDEHFGVDPDDSGSEITAAKSASDGLAPDNPLKAKLDAKIKELEAPLEADPDPAPKPFLKTQKQVVGKKYFDAIMADGKQVGWIQQRGDGTYWYAPVDANPLTARWSPGGVTRQDAMEAAAGVREYGPVNVTRDPATGMYKTPDGRFTIERVDDVVIGENADGSDKIGSMWNIGEGGFAHPENDGYHTLSMAQLKIGSILHREQKDAAAKKGAPEPGAPETDIPKVTRVKGFTKAQTINMREYYGEGGPGHADAADLGFDPATIGETYIDVVDLDRAIEKLSADYADSSKWMKRNTPYKQYKALREQGLGLPGERQSVNNVRRRLERMRKEQGGAPKTSVPVATSTNVGPTAVDAGVAIKDLSDVDLVGRYKVDLADGVDVKDVRRELVRRNISVKDAGEGLLVKKTTAPSTIADVESIAKIAGDDSVRLMAAVDTLREVRTDGGLDDTPTGKVLLAMARALNDGFVTKADGPKPLPPAYAKIYADELRPYDYEPGVAALVTALDKIVAGGPPGKA